MMPLGGYPSPGSEITDPGYQMPVLTDEQIAAWGIGDPVMTQANASVNTNQGYQDLSVFLPAHMRTDDIPPAAPKAKIMSPFVKFAAAAVLVFLIWKIWR